MFKMMWATWKCVLVVLGLASAQRSIPTACEEDACRCDSFTRLICHCTGDYQELTLRSDGAYRIPTMVTAVIVNGCDRVTFLSETVRNLIQLRTIQIANVNNVVINERALAWSPRDNEMNPGLRIMISNSTISEISSHGVQGRINSIIISDSYINNLKPFAFSSLTGVSNIELTNNVFDNVEIQAFKKFTTSNFLIRGGSAKVLPSRFLSDVEVTDLLRIDGVTVVCLSSLTFLVSLPKRVLIENNNIDILEGDCFRVTSRGPITFRNNTVGTIRKGAFYGFAASPEVFSVTGHQELLIDNNTVTNITPTSLMYNRTTLSLRIDGLNLKSTCDCDLAEGWQSVLSEHGGIINCWYDLEEHFVSIPTYVDSRCGKFKQTFWIFVIVGVIIVLLAAAVVIFFIVKKENEKKKKIQIVMPDGKTYRETEFHIVVERAELLTTDL
nr:uncharacterized protein LOC116777940 [Danaus plexippus plexippus]